MRPSPSTGPRRIPLILLLVLVVTVLAIVLWPSRPAGAAQNRLHRWLAEAQQHGWPSWFGFDQVEWTANVIMMVPLGLLAGLAFGPGRWWLILLAGLVFSSGVEVAQHLAYAHRTGSVLDVVANVLGTTIGLALAVGIGRRQAGDRAVQGSVNPVHREP